MEHTMKKTDKQKKLDAILARQDVANFESSLTRARSVTVGTAFGGVTEISMRSQEGYVTWAPLQPIEVIELIHQLAANVGCHINIQPRDDFSSWREWRVTEQEKLHLNGRPPFPNDMALHNHVGATLPSAAEQPGLQIETPIKEQENVVATKKTVGRKRIKHPAKTP
jgi:hypothetical protein